ncbi:MBL fold metallo-hydrolase [Cohnella nanjingensis]|uniref:MBL fold metallo-hydrolase n=1 Tax=Cohnella nanjingensis TaxID=1387779 RepID=A0A7X0RM51_9BACL|nr:MBL fold metallo-hydrolase [Cohnella nanjingensis]MBB6669823.1 MBL fold metallo-hydrolase [Cohnella nanjingensis]
MNVQKLPWAGIRVTSGTSAVVIDPLYNFPTKYGSSNEPLFPLRAFGPANAVLITHEHGDHFDPAAIIDAYGPNVPVFLPAESVAVALAAGLTNATGASVGEAFRIGAFTATATYSVDGVGDCQVAWVVDDGERRLFHGGDTLWHGYWWKIAKAFGPFDAVCLPVNGAILERPDMTPFSGMPITLIPEQAVAAAVVLGAKRLVPIHHTAIHKPPLYRQTDDWQGRLRSSADGKMEVALLASKESITL